MVREESAAPPESHVYRDLNVDWRERRRNLLRAQVVRRLSVTAALYIALTYNAQGRVVSERIFTLQLGEDTLGIELSTADSIATETEGAVQDDIVTLQAAKHVSNVSSRPAVDSHCAVPRYKRTSIDAHSEK